MGYKSPLAYATGMTTHSSALVKLSEWLLVRCQRVEMAFWEKWNYMQEWTNKAYRMFIPKEYKRVSKNITNIPRPVTPSLIKE